MVQLEVDMVLLRAAAATLADLDGHRAGDDVAGGQVLKNITFGRISGLKSKLEGNGPIDQRCSVQLDMSH